MKEGIEREYEVEEEYRIEECEAERGILGIEIKIRGM